VGVEGGHVKRYTEEEEDNGNHTRRQKEWKADVFRDHSFPVPPHCNVYDEADDSGIVVVIRICGQYPPPPSSRLLHWRQYNCTHGHCAMRRGRGQNRI
jgi:hypothetical protein